MAQFSVYPRIALSVSTGQQNMAGSLPVVIASDQSAVNVAITGTVPLPTGAATAAKQDTGNTSLASIDGKLPATLGQLAMAASLAVTIASNQSALAVSQSGNWSTRTQDGSGTAITSTASALDVNLKTSSITLTVSGTVAATQSGTWNINNISGTVSLPTGAATETTLAAASAKLPATLGQKAMSASLAVALASDQSAIPVSQSGTWNINNVSGTVSLPPGASTETTLAALSAKLPSAAALADATSNPTTTLVGAMNEVYNGSTWDRAYSASSANLSAKSGKGALITTQPGMWAINAQAAGGSAASASKTAVASTRHVCTSIAATLVQGATTAATGGSVLLRDGSTGAGTILWIASWGVTNVTGTSYILTLSGLHIVGSVNTAMTLEGDVGLTGVLQTVSMTGYDIT